MNRPGRSIFIVFAVAVVVGCVPRSESSDGGSYSAEISNVVTRLSSETAYESLGTKTVTYEVTGDILLKSDGGAAADSGELLLSIAETTGFNSRGDQPVFFRVPILNGKGRLDAKFFNSEYPVSKPTAPPRIYYRFANFTRLEPVVSQVGGDSRSSVNAVRFEVIPTGVKVTKGLLSNTRTHTANYEFNITGTGALAGKTFSLIVLKSTLEHSSTDNVGNTEMLRFPVNKGEGKHYEAEYLGTVSENEGAPAKPRYDYQLLGIIREIDAEIVEK